MTYNLNGWSRYNIKNDSALSTCVEQGSHLVCVQHFFCVELVASNRTPPRHHPPPGLTRSRSPGPLQKRPRGRPPLSTDNRDHATHVALDRSRVLLSTELASHQRRRAGPAAVEGSPLPHHTSHHTIHGHLGMAWPSPRGARKQPPRGRSRGPPTRPASASASTVTDLVVQTHYCC